MSEPNKRQPEQQNILLGIGLDEKDGQTRITRGKNFALIGGSEETHSQMQETAIKVNEKVKRRGKTIGNIAPQELQDIILDVTDRIK